MKNILFLTHLYPYPPNDGGRIVTYNTLKELSAFGHKIKICTFFDIEKDNLSLFPLDISVTAVPIDYSNTFLGAMKNLFSKLPYNMEKYISKEMEEKILTLLEEQKFDLVYIDHLHMAYYAKKIREKLPRIKMYLRQHNVENLILKRVCDNDKRLIPKLYFKMQFLRLYLYEKDIVNYFDECFMITPEDLNLMSSMNDKVKLSLLPAGVDTDKYKPIEHRLTNKPTIVFVGSMAWLPNAKGVEWFIENVFYDLLNEVPDLQFYVVGKNPPVKITKLMKKYPNNIIVTGFVDDERPYIASSDVFIVPLKIGGGMRIKILNALAMKKPVLSTSVGAEGLNLDKGSLEIADSDKDFLNRLLYLLRNKEYSQTISSKGYKNVREKYSNTVILKKHAEYLDDAF